MNPTLETWMPEARQIVAQCLCDEETKGIEMDTRLAEACAKRIAAWMDSAAQFARNEEYYRGLLVRCGNAIGPEAFICDDGSKSEDVLVAKVAQLVEMQCQLYKDLVHYNGKLCAQVNRLISTPLSRTP